MPITNTFNANVNSDTFNVVGTVNNTFNMSGVTGNFVNMSFYFQEYGLYTGYNLAESFIGKSFYFTGYALGLVNSGTNGILSGSLYQRSPEGVKSPFVNFTLSTGFFFYASGGFSQQISGLHRVGLDISNIGSGMTGLTVGIFGVG